MEGDVSKVVIENIDTQTCVRRTVSVYIVNCVVNTKHTVKGETEIKIDPVSDNPPFGSIVVEEKTGANSFDPFALYPRNNVKLVRVVNICHTPRLTRTGAGRCIGPLPIWRTKYTSDKWLPRYNHRYEGGIQVDASQFFLSCDIEQIEYPPWDEYLRDTIEKTKMGTVTLTMIRQDRLIYQDDHLLTLMRRLLDDNADENRRKWSLYLARVRHDMWGRGLGNSSY